MRAALRHRAGDLGGRDRAIGGAARSPSELWNVAISACSAYRPDLVASVFAHSRVSGLLGRASRGRKASEKIKLAREREAEYAK